MEVGAADPYTTNPGPIDGSVLYDQEKHVSTAVWEGQERGALRCHEHTSKLDQWTLTPKQIELLSWLKEFFSRCPDDAPIEVIEQHTRAYLLYLVGSTIFSTTTGNKVPVMYLPLFENFVRCGQYAWGAAALSFLYRALGNASLKTQSTISGCLTLLQVEWLPYRNMDSMVIPDHIKSTLILGRSKTMLICFDKAERHLPNRCLRQYGMLQSIPDDVERWERKSRGVDSGVDLSGKMESELTEWMDRQLHIVDGDEGVDESEYMDWYMRITRRFIGRPISLSSEFQRTNAGLRDIAHLADTFSTKGLDPQQIESISRIRYIAHECLRDQISGPTILTATPQAEHGKRVRGKERVRRKGGAGKRLRKDGAVLYNAVSEDEQPQFYGNPIEVGQMHLSHMDREMDHHAQLCTVESAVNSVHMIHADADAENMHLCDAHLGVDQSDLGYEDDENDDDVAVEFNHEDLKQEADEEIKEELNHMTGEENIEELQIHQDRRPCDHIMIDDSQFCDVSHSINNTTLSDDVDEINHTHFGDPDEVDPLGINPTEEDFVNSQLSHVNDESEPSASVMAGIEVSQHHGDISQKGDCSVAV
ncbi:hypothetical protein TSUD_131460 [Trifolium subterraneum]|uniref:Aminotransferase-like plant mobile domain-containing protein n=1 Tax=Trifolium subterraneum TaxID=3900 RepID=A0A2Z6PKH5_TRISU|nr:hypothetical protein TSUD_131460 [Trifolium subterraneum]